VKRLLLPAVAAAVAAAVVTAPVAPRPAAPVPLSARALTMPTLGEIGPQPVPGDAALARTAGATGVIPAGAYTRARTAALKTKAVGGTWRLQGPTNIGGRVLDVVMDPLKPDSIYIATATGGVWHSGDAGVTWAPAWPETYNQSIGALAVAPDGTLYAGTGEAGPGGGSLTYGGDGVYRSRDGGRTWQNIGLKTSERIGRIVVDPKDPKRVWVAANGPLFATGGERGLYLSTDGGDTWGEPVLEGITETTGAVDVALDPEDSDVVYAAMWDRLRHPDSRDYTGGGSALYKSTDAGETWTAIGTNFFGPNLETVGRLGVAAAPGGIVYVISSTVLGATGGFYKSTDAGATFTPQPLDPELVTGGLVYAWWFGRVYVDPKDANHVFVTGVNLSESTNGGQSFTAPGGIHADQHGMAWDPRVEERVYLGNDGGMYRSDDNGRTWEHGEYMPWNQLFSIDVSQQTPSRIVGGLQDNGGNRSWTPDGETAPDAWNDITGGDGTEMRINPENEQIVYGCSQYGACAVSRDGGNNMKGFGDFIVGNRKNWLTPIEFEPGNPSTVYTASAIVHRSTDDGQTWEPISLDLTDGEAGSTETNPLFRNYNTVSTLGVTSSDVGFLLAGTDDGNLWYSHDNAANPATSWVKVNDSDLPKAYVTSVAIDPANYQTAYAAFSGFRGGDNAANIFKSTDKGVTWENISAGLPVAPVGKVLPIGDDLFVGTDVGVFMAPGVGKGKAPKWQRVGSGLPMAPIWDLAYQRETHTLYAANFGRGAYTISLAGISKQPQAPTRPERPRRPDTRGGNPGGGGTTPSTGLPSALPLLAAAGAAGSALLVRRRRRDAA
jgi:photosystem II stability/assembly factor-like uncharacterized protein